MSYLVALSLSVLLATGTPCESTIVEGTQYGVPGETRSIVTYDADFDLRPDIVATVAGTNALTLLSNRSDGFHAVPVALSHPAELVIVADVDGDSVNELLAVGPVNLSTLFANGDGTFRIVPNTFSGAPIDLFLDRHSSTGDVTGDGKLDFVALSSRSTAFPKPLLRVFAGGGDGTFTHLASPELPRGVDMISIGEVTGDGKADVLVGDTAEAAVLPSNGDGTFGPRRVLNNTSRTVLAVDIDRDGRADIMTFSDTAPGRMLFLSSHSWESPLLHNLPGSSHIADLDGDGDLDFVSGNRVFRAESDNVGPDLARKWIAHDRDER